MHAFDFYDDMALLDRLTRGVLKSGQQVVFLVGSALSAPPSLGQPGVPGVEGVIDLIREEFGDQKLSADFEKAINAQGSNRYQSAFRYLIGHRGQQAANEVIRRSVWKARKSALVPQQYVPSKNTSDEICRSCDDDLEGWLLPPGIEAAGALIAQYPMRFGKVALTTNFDPLLEVSVAHAGGVHFRTVLHGDGNIGQTEGNGCHVIHLHGYWHGADTLHTPRQLAQPRPQLRNSLIRTGRRLYSVVLSCRRVIPGTLYRTRFARPLAQAVDTRLSLPLKTYGPFARRGFARRQSCRYRPFASQIVRCGKPGWCLRLAWKGPSIAAGSSVGGSGMSTSTIASAGRFLILPVLFAGLVAITIQGHALDQRLPHWETLLTIATVILMERLYANTRAVSQKALLVRDLTSTFVNVFIAGVVTGFVVLPVLNLITQHLFGRKFVFVSSLGPIWLQVVAILLLVSFFRYWMHRLQHRNAFLWKLHSYHHRVTDLRALNDLTSNPVDFALRNLLVYVLLGVVGFDSLAFLFAVPALSVWGIFSHCGGDVRGGWLNYVVATPEVHRWHHTTEVPQGYGNSVNYGVEFSFWDLLFGTYYLPRKDGQPIRPNIGHPAGLPDESSYLRLLLVPFGLYGIVSWLKRRLRIPDRPEGPQPAE